MIIGIASQYLANGRTGVLPALHNLWMRLILIVSLLAYPLIAREPLAKRIAHTDPSKYRREAHVHEGAGEMLFEELFDTSAFDTTLLFLHRGVLPPKAGIGHHYHNQMEEMFLSTLLSCTFISVRTFCMR